MAVRAGDFLTGAADPQQQSLGVRAGDFLPGGPASPEPQLEVSIADEFARGVVSGTENLQATMFGVAALTGREFGIESLENFGIAGVERHQLAAAQAAPTVQSLGDIEGVEDFFRFAAGGIGQALPSLTSVVAGGGIGGIIAKKAIERKIRTTISNRMLRTMKRKGFKDAEARGAIDRALRGRTGQQMLLQGVTKGTPNAQLLTQAFARGATQAAVGLSALPQIGQIDIELQAAGQDAGLTAVLGGILGGVLEALPALRLLDKMFPGIDKAVSKSFVKDVAIGSGTQALLEGSTEAAQEMIAIAAVAYHDPSFDPFSPESALRVADSFAIGAMVGAVTGAGAQAFGDTQTATRRRIPKAEPKMTLPAFDFAQEPPATIPEGFNPADDTLFAEIRNRVSGAAAAVINPVMNTVRDKAQAGFDALDVQFSGGMNNEGKRLSKIIKDAHNSFVAEHTEEIGRIRAFAGEATQALFQKVEGITDPAAREQAIQAGLDQVAEQVNKLSSLLQKRANKAEESVISGVSSFNQLDELFDRQTQEDLTEGEPTTVEQEDVPVRFTFGKDRTGGVQRDRGTVAPSDPEAAKGWGSKELARRQMLKTRKQFPSVPDSAWALKQKEDGTWVYEIATAEGNQLLADDALLNDGIESARLSARGNRDPARPRAKVQSVTNPNQKTTVDLITLAHAGRGLNEQSVTLRQGLITALGRVFDRGGIDRKGFNNAVRTYDKAFPREARDATKFNIGPQGQDPDVRLRADIREPRDRKNAARDAELAAEFTDPDAIPIGEEPEATGLQKQPSREQQARQSKAARVTPVTKQPGVKVTEKVKQPTVTVIASKASEAAMGAELKALVERFTKLLSRKGTTVTVVETRGETEVALPQYLKDLTGTLEFIIMEALSPASVHYNIDTGEVSIFIHSFTQNKGEAIGFLMHELGHVVHYDTWHNLNRVEQDALWEAFKADVEAGRTTGGALQREVAGFENMVDPNTPAPLTIFEFREWMADQFVAWTAGRSKPTGVLKSFLEKIGAKLQQLYDYIQQNPGRMGKLNETYAQFADAVAKKAVGLNPPGINYFVREGQAGRDFRTIATSVLSDVVIEDLNDIDAHLRAMRDATDTDIVAAGIAAIPVKQKSALQKRAARYPAILKNAEAVNRWVKNAWNLALSPATNVMRRIGERVPVANEIANIFGRNIGKPKTSQNYHDRTDQMKGSWRAKYETITAGLTAVEKEALARRLQELDGTDSKPATLRERQMRKFFDDLLVYLRESGLPVAEVRNYFPRAFNYELMINDEKKIIAHLQSKHNMSLDNARGFYQSMISPEMRDAAALGRQVPAFKAMRSRTLTDPFFKKYQSETLDGIVSNYINGAVKRAEYNRFLGSKAPLGATRADDLKKTTWNPKGKLEAFYDKAKQQGATEEDLKTISMYVDAQLGMLGRDNKIAQKGRTAMAAMVAYQNMRVLMFTVFASLPDLMGPAIRAGSMAAAFSSISNNMEALLKSDGDIADMARAYGIISSEASNHIMTEYVDNHFMPPGLRKMNETFFKWTGLNWYTDFTRKMALAVGVDYIKSMAGRSTDLSVRSRDRIRAQAALKELGLTKEAVDSWVADGEPVWGSLAYTKTGKAARADQAVSESLIQFVNESIMRPNASQRPILASHPNAMLVFHLKGYMYAMHEVVLKRLGRNLALAKTNYEMAAAIAPAIAIFALTAVGLELRELMQYAFTGRTPPTNRMGMHEYMGTLVDRSGLLGQSQMMIDGASGDVAFLAGPAMGQLTDLIERPGPTLARATPIFSQMPSLRQMF